MTKLKTKQQAEIQIIHQLKGTHGISFVEFALNGKVKILAYETFVKRYGVPKYLQEHSYTPQEQPKSTKPCDDVDER